MERELEADRLLALRVSSGEREKKREKRKKKLKPFLRTHFECVSSLVCSICNSCLLFNFHGRREEFIKSRFGMFIYLGE